MAFIEWYDGLSVGVQEIDKQHQGLIRIINQLHKAMEQGKGNTVVDATLNELLEYAVTHFQTEEKYFSQFQYPEEFEHKIEHQNFVEEVEKRCQQFHEGSIAVTTQLLTFLNKWLINHINGTDKKYTQCFHDHGLS